MPVLALDGCAEVEACSWPVASAQQRWRAVCWRHWRPRACVRLQSVRSWALVRQVHGLWRGLQWRLRFRCCCPLWQGLAALLKQQHLLRASSAQQSRISACSVLQAIDQHWSVSLWKPMHLSNNIDHCTLAMAPSSPCSCSSGGTKQVL
jgi:hypothetical protein